jgi:hypothetical protein
MNLLEKLTAAQLPKLFLAFTEPKTSLLLPQEAVMGPYPVPD